MTITFVVGWLRELARSAVLHTWQGEILVERVEEPSAGNIFTNHTPVEQEAAAIRNALPA